MSVDVSSSILIKRSRAIVSEYAANPDNAPNWYVNIKVVEWKTSLPGLYLRASGVDEDQAVGCF